MNINWRHRLYRLFLSGVLQYRRQGLYRTLLWSKDSLLWQIKRINPEFNRRFLEHLSFDRRYGVDTYGTVMLDYLKLSEKQKNTGHRYDPCFPWLVRDYLSKINVDYRDYEFVDLGSGKGRVLLLAASYPFKRVSGVEFSEELNNLAKHNISAARIPNQACSCIESVCEDASKFIFPENPLIISLFNPFGALILQAVLNNLLTSLRQKSREAYIVYVYPVYKQLIEESGRFAAILKTEKYIIYRYKTDNKEAN